MRKIRFCIALNRIRCSECKPPLPAAVLTPCTRMLRVAFIPSRLRRREIPFAMVLSEQVTRPLILETGSPAPQLEGGHEPFGNLDGDVLD